MIKAFLLSLALVAAAPVDNAASTPLQSGESSTAPTVLAATSTPFFESGRQTLKHGEEVCVETSVSEPLIFFGGVNRGEILDTPAMVPRVKLVEQAGAKSKFCMRLAVPPCTAPPTADSPYPQEEVDYFIVSNDRPQNKKEQYMTDIGGVNVAISTVTVAAGDKKAKVKIPYKPRSAKFQNKAVCLTTIQTQNADAVEYLQVNPEREDAYRIRTRVVSTKSDPAGNGKKKGEKEVVGVFCVEDKAGSFPLKLVDEAKGIDMEINRIQSNRLDFDEARGWGLINVPTAASHNAVVLSGELNGGDPYHMRVVDKNNGAHTFLIEEDNCGGTTNPSHKPEWFTTAAFNVAA